MGSSESLIGLSEALQFADIKSGFRTLAEECYSVAATVVPREQIEVVRSRVRLVHFLHSAFKAPRITVRRKLQEAGRSHPASTQ